MILVDFSSILYQSLYSSIKAVNPQKISEKYTTSDYIKVTIDFILENIFKYQNEYSNYGQLVLCVDDHANTNWRKQYLNTYKFNRKSNRDHSDINFSEVFQYTNELLSILDMYTPFKVVKADQAEGDDIILTLVKNYRIDNIIIISTDKDMIQSKLYNNKVIQISPITQKTISFEDKEVNSLKEWLQLHLCLGDEADNIPRIVNNIKFSNNFKTYLTKNNYNITEYEFNESQDLREQVLKNYTIAKTDKNGNQIELDVFEKPRFGKASLFKKINEYGSLNNWVNTDPNLKRNYELNKKLILAEYIPAEIQNQIVENFKSSKTEYKQKEFADYINKLGLTPLLFSLPKNFSSKFNLADW